MNKLHTPQLEKVYSAKTLQQSEEAYDEWSPTYEVDTHAYGYRLPAVAATVLSRFVSPGEGPLLDAGCGTGLQAEPLRLAGYEPIVGIDLSAGMLDVAKRKNLYSELHRMTLGERLSFADDSFANTLSVGTITPGHAPPSSYEELIRVTRKGGLIVFSLRVDAGQDPAYLSAVVEHEKASRWTQIFESGTFAPMPVGEPDVLHKVLVARVT